MVKYLDYKNEKLPVRLSYGMFQGMKKDIGVVDMSKLQQMDSEVMENMLWHGLISGYKHDKQEFLFDKKDMEEILEECMMDFLSLVPLFFPKAKLGNALPNLNNPQKEAEEQTPAGQEKI